MCVFFVKTNEKEYCFRVPQISSLPQSRAKEKSSGVEIGVTSKNKFITIPVSHAHACEICSLFCLLEKLEMTQSR